MEVRLGSTARPKRGRGPQLLFARFKRVYMAALVGCPD